MRAVTVYLAGAIAGCDDATAKGWRNTATTALRGVGIDVRDPIARADYRNVPVWTRELVAEVVDGDMKDIRESDIVLVRAVSPSWGTAMEIRFANEIGRPVVAFGVGLHGASVSPWVLYHANCYAKFDDAIAFVGTLASELTATGLRAPLTLPTAPTTHRTAALALKVGESVQMEHYWMCQKCTWRNPWYTPRRHTCDQCGASRYLKVVRMNDYGKGATKEISLGRKRP